MNVKQLNYSMYKAAEHMFEAAKFLMVIDKNRALIMMKEAEVILSVIKPEPEVISQERLDSVLNEIMNVELERP